MHDYTGDFFEEHRRGARRSARVIVPIVQRLIEPRSAIDVGCGLGTWLAVCQELGIADIMGVDGPYLDMEALDIPADRFFAWDLEQPLSLDRAFDLVLSLEVAEHLPQSCADVFVDSLTSLGPVVLFSAAIPKQGGTNHVNEQWPEYWVARFARRGYAPVDCIRPAVWGRYPDVEWWCAQNTFLFAAQDFLRTRPNVAAADAGTHGFPLSVVHPECYVAAINAAASAAPPNGGGRQARLPARNDKASSHVPAGVMPADTTRGADVHAPPSPRPSGSGVQRRRRADLATTGVAAELVGHDPRRRMCLTVAICTWNRSALLRQTLEEMTRLAVPAEVDWELLVVNNNSTDDTDAVIESFASRLPLRRLFEPNPGKSHALNHAAREAAGEYILWTDDDVLIDPDWLAEYHRAIVRKPDASRFGGPIAPWFAGAPPAWLPRVMSTDVKHVYATLEPTAAMIPITSEYWPYGPNLVMRTADQLLYPYDPGLGPRPTSSVRGEETAGVHQMLADGLEGWWVPAARVQHYVPVAHQTIAYIRRYMVARGEY